MSTNEKKTLEEIGLLYAIAYTAEHLATNLPTGSAEAIGHTRQAAFARAYAKQLTQKYCEKRKRHLG